MKFFSVEGPLFKFFDRLWDIIKLNFIWLICCIPVVTFGPATVAAFSITLHMADDTEGYIVKPFFKAFKANMKKGIPLGLLFLGATYCLYLYVQLIFKAKTYQGIILALGIVFFVIYVDMFIYAFALLARYENTLGKTILNSYKISMKFNLRTVLLVGILIVEIGVFIWNDILMVVGLLIAPTLIMLTISGFAMYMFKKLELEPGAVTNTAEDSTDEVETHRLMSDGNGESNGVEEDTMSDVERKLPDEETESEASEAEV